jgi:hypothetical protein
VVEGGLPPVTFVVTNAAVSATAGSGRALTPAILAAMGTGLVLALVAVVQRRPLQQALAGLTAVALAAGYAAWADDARAFFLPGIWVDAAYALALAGSVLAGRPLIGTVHDWLFSRDHRRWREDIRLRRAVVVLTFGWAGVYAVRASVQATLYASNQPELLALTKLGLGWPLTVAAAAVSLAWLRHQHTTDDRPGEDLTPSRQLPR